MASLSQSSWFSSLHNIKAIHSPQSAQTPLIFSTNHKPSSFKTLKRSSFALGSLSDEFSPPNSSDTPEVPEEPKPDRVKLAFERAREYKKSLKFDQVRDNSQDTVGESAEITSGSGGLVPGNEDGGSKEVSEAVKIEMENVREYQQEKGTVGKRNEESDNLPGDGHGEKEITEAVRIAVEKAKEYQKNKGAMGGGISNVDGKLLPVDGGKKEVPAAVRIAMEKAKEYKENKGNVNDNGSSEGGEQLPGGVKEDVPEALRIAMEKAREYKKNKGTLDNNSSSADRLKLTGGNAGSLGNESTEKKTGKNEELKISSIDFVGLDFADKKKGRGLPAGLVPVSDPFPEGDLPEVEIIVGDASKLGNTMPSETTSSEEEESVDLYKPKVSTWGMFPRPSNISKTFGGGRNIRPGEAVETPEQKAAKEARTRQLLAAYKSKIGLNMDPKLKAECEKALKDGDSLMDVGRLKEALPYYQEVMDKLSFQTELHGLAALQWSICQDSLSRPEKARVMYEKLQSHPNAQVSKRARQFMFSFQAMEMMKVTRSTNSPRNIGYQKYFEAFVDDKERYSSGDEAEKKDGALIQALPYIVFLASPILIVLLVAASKGI